MRYIPGMQSHSCTPFGTQGTCVVRTSPFESICVGVKAKPKSKAMLTVRHTYDQATLLSVCVCMHNGTLPCSDNIFSSKGVISSNGEVKEMLGSVLGSSW